MIKAKMILNEHKLDNPVWNSLNEIHHNYAIAYGGVRFYHPEYCPFGSIAEIHDSIKGINEYSTLVDDFYVVGEKPLPSNVVILKKGLVCNQMLLKKAVPIETDEKIIELKSEKQKAILYDLVNLIQPRYFTRKTVDLGKYFGIYKNSELVAVAGERMKMNGFTEISSVVTHPEHTGRGYAKQLITHTTNHIFNENKIPYLHVLESNSVAIRLYEKLGFTTRGKMSFWNLNSN